MLSYPEQTFSSIYYLNDFMGSSCDVLGGFSGPGLMVSHFKSQLSWPVHLPRPLTHTHTHTQTHAPNLELIGHSRLSKEFIFLVPLIRFDFK